MPNQFLDHVAASTELAAVSKAAIGVGAGGAVIFGIDSQVIGVVGGIVIGVLGLVYNIWSTERRLKIMSRRDD